MSSDLQSDSDLDSIRNSCDVFLQLSYNDSKYLLWHWPHYEDGEPDKYEEGATDADHRECPEVDLTIAFGIREKLMISKSIDWKCSSHTWEVVSTDLLRKKLVVLLHLLASKMAKSFVLTDVTIFCPSGCHNFLSSGCPQEGFGVRLSHSSFNLWQLNKWKGL